MPPKGCFSLLEVRPICVVPRGHGGGELGVTGSLRAHHAHGIAGRSNRLQGFQTNRFCFGMSRECVILVVIWMFGLIEGSLEIFFKDSRTLLAVFLNGAHRLDISQRLQVIITRHSTHEHLSTLGLVLREMSIAMPKGKGKVALTTHEKALATAQRRWKNREISNVGGPVRPTCFMSDLMIHSKYTYLSILNQLSGRTPSDATQYPVFRMFLY